MEHRYLMNSIQHKVVNVVLGTKVFFLKIRKKKESSSVTFPHHIRILMGSFYARFVFFSYNRRSQRYTNETSSNLERESECEKIKKPTRRSLRRSVE